MGVDVEVCVHSIGCVRCGRVVFIACVCEIEGWGDREEWGDPLKPSCSLSLYLTMWTECVFIACVLCEMWKKWCS